MRGQRPSWGECLFLSTLSLRRATDRYKKHRLQCNFNFYPRSPCGERRSARPETRRRDVISIHALLAESDRLWAFSDGSGCLFLSTLSLRRATPRQTKHCKKLRFLSTLSLRRATECRAIWNNRSGISIHALLAESDRRRRTVTKTL